MNVLVTGGAGYIGAFTVRALLQAGHKVTVLDRLSTGRTLFQPECTIYPHAVRDIHLVDKDIDAVIHLAGSCYVLESVRWPVSYYRNNVGETSILLDWMVQKGINKLVFASSCTAGVEKSPYGRSKLMAEAMLEDVSRHVTSVALRYFNAAGAAADRSIGELHDPEIHLIPQAIAAAYSGTPLVIRGDQHGTPDGTCIRDYVHVEDIAAANLVALTYLVRRGPTARWDIGSGVGHSVREVVGVVEKVTGKPVRIEVGDSSAAEAALAVADPSEARKHGWSPWYDLTKIVETADAFYRKRRGM